MEQAKIMVVEDSSIIAFSTKHKLRKFGYAVPVVVSAGEEAIYELEVRDFPLVVGIDSFGHDVYERK